MTPACRGVILACWLHLACAGGGTIAESKDFTGRLKKFFYFAARAICEKWDGCTGVESLLHVLKTPYERSLHRGLLVDVGAHTGAGAASMAMLFSSGMFFERIDVKKATDDLCVKMGPEPKLVMFEPNPHNIQLLSEQILGVQQFLQTQGRSFKFRVVQAAVSNIAGRELFMHAGATDQIGALGNVTSTRDFWHKTRVSKDIVNVVTLDSFLGNHSIFLLKIDTEGHDGKVLLGSRKLLRAQKIRFIVFEVLRASGVTGMGSTSLQRLTARLYKYKYLCFLMTRTALVPLWSPWWTDYYERWKTWANVFCGLADDPGLFQAYVAYGTNHLTLEFALQHLKPDAQHSPVCADWPECKAVF